jgi:hypothetical protein
MFRADLLHRCFGIQPKARPYQSLAVALFSHTYAMWSDSFMTDKCRLNFLIRASLIAGAMLLFTSFSIRAMTAVDIIIDNLDANTYRNGSWDNSSGLDPFGGNSVYSKSFGSTFSWQPTLPVAGTYAVYAWWTHHPKRSTNVPYHIEHDGGIATVTVDQQDAGLVGQWQLLGQYPLTPGANGQVTISGENGQASADAVRFVLAEADAPNVPAGTAPPVELVIDDRDPYTEQIGNWADSGGLDPFGGNSVYSKSSGSTFSWQPALPVSGIYDIYAWWTHRPNRSTNVPYRIEHDTGIETVTVNQQDENLAGQWQLLGRYTLTAGLNGRVTVSGENGQTSADAVRFVLADGGNVPPPDPVAGARSATLTWSPPTSNTDGTTLRDLATYRIRAGTAPAALNQVIDINAAGISAHVINNLTAAVWYFQMTAINVKGIESVPSNRISIDLRN